MPAFNGLDQLGATAFLTAAGRALEAAKDEPLAIDPYAAVFCKAAGWDAILDGMADPEFRQHFTDFQGARTRFFDACLRDALADGVRQVVIPAAGLDSRAYRFIWPDGCEVYELDQQPLLDWKHAVLDEAGHTPATALYELGVDLRTDWVSSLLAAGFDPLRRSCWLVEGLLLYLPRDDQERLYRIADRLSAPGSWFVTNDSAALLPAEFAAKVTEEIATGASPHFQLISNDRSPVAPWFSERGWVVTETPVGEYLRNLGRETPGPSIARDSLVAAIKG